MSFGHWRAACLIYENHKQWRHSFALELKERKREGSLGETELVQLLKRKVVNMGSKDEIEYGQYTIEAKHCVLLIQC